jgi:L-rhamnose-H+ transport protein
MPTDNINLGTGILLAISAGGLLGTFAWPMKLTNKWKWENVWIVYCLWALVIIPFLLGFITTPNLINVLFSAPSKSIVIVALFALGWGIAATTYGIGFNLVGLALGVAIPIGFNIAFGSILPVILYHPERLLKPIGIALTAGVIVIIAGLVICAIAGLKKEKAQLSFNNASSTKEKPKMIKGLIICVITGIFAPMFNFVMIYSEPIRAQAVAAGATRLNSFNAVWCIALPIGFIVNFAYCLYLLGRNKSWRLYKSGSNVYWLYTLIMGVMYMAGVTFFGMGVSTLGDIGPSVGWAIVQSTTIVSANLVGIISGEWKNAGKGVLNIMFVGLFIIIVGICIIAWSGTL